MPKKSSNEEIEAARTEVADRLAAGEIGEEEAAELDAKLVAKLTGVPPEEATDGGG